MHNKIDNFAKWLNTAITTYDIKTLPGLNDTDFTEVFKDNTAKDNFMGNLPILIKQSAVIKNVFGRARKIWENATYDDGITERKSLAKEDIELIKYKLIEMEIIIKHLIKLVNDNEIQVMEDYIKLCGYFTLFTEHCKDLFSLAQ